MNKKGRERAIVGQSRASLAVVVECFYEPEVDVKLLHDRIDEDKGRRFCFGKGFATEKIENLLKSVGITIHYNLRDGVVQFDLDLTVKYSSVKEDRICRLTGNVCTPSEGHRI